MPRILINTTSLFNRLRQGLLPRGINRVQLAYIQEYQHEALAVIELNSASKILHFVFPPSISQQLFALLLTFQNSDKGYLWQLICKGILGSYFKHSSEPKVQFNLAHNGFLTPGYADFFKKRNIQLISMIHDLIPITHAEYCRPQAQQKHFFRVKNILNQADGIVTNSEATSQALLSFAAQNRFPVPPLISAPLASSFLTSSPTNSLRPFAKPYFLILGAKESRKNHWFIFHIWNELIKELGDQTPKLIVIGQRGWGYDAADNFLKSCKNLQNFVYELDACEDATLQNYIKHAQALLFPSFIEGYGLPLIEALTMQTPVIASDLEVYKEFAADIPAYLSPLDGKGWLKMIKDYHNQNSRLRQQQLARMQRFVAPTWSQHFEKVNDFLVKLQDSREKYHDAKRK